MTGQTDQQRRGAHPRDEAVSYKEHSDKDLVRLCLKSDERAARELVE